MELQKDKSGKKDILVRLKRIEGQVKGLQRMLEDDKCCPDILVQVAAVRAAVNKVGVLIFEEHSKTCLKDALNADNNEALDNLIDVLGRFIK
ncbi:MAG: metal-sensitive transcriptional regulator [Peptococcaceae bacterium]|nr:metal-sensitive transcriptional regulator [Peptococcaceae bacterium]